MRFKGLDLNLLVALDALMIERNLTAAARSINLSQPAMSAAVRRLRSYFRDELFTMRGREFVPTPRAEDLAPAIREALQHIRLNIIPWDKFTPDQSDRHFRVSLCDFVTVVLFQKILERLAREAPGISFDLLPLTDNPDELLRRGDVDFLISPPLFMSSAHPKIDLFQERLTCVGCSNNKQLEEALTAEEYSSMGHAVVRFGRTQQPTIEDCFLQEHGLKRRVEVVVSSFSMIPAALMGTDRIATVPFRLVGLFEDTIPLRMTAPPIALPTFTEAVQWPVLHDKDPANIWMRDIMVQEAARLP
ncbi:LysR family transcriptional regulator [Rhizobium vallis]|uniref:LysR family transcriptional regulator n=2 Tax=Rhizobium TaxID=379 RepID=A0A2A6J1H9_9HYPH|nr:MULTISPECIES: transcriptional regulator NodD3 [Rhizobium]PDS27532.1 LysR family transcriptional regulator [Rhizobium phaseoli]PDT00039.1 LysR family transcriptional regulator [Rhizobium chutanense]RUM17471.1 LysR family transcriptional regulator [Rhizobium vallis]